MSKDSKKLQKEFSNYRKRTQQEIERARKEGYNHALSDFVGLIDDCDRALEFLAIENSAEAKKISVGIEHLRDNAIEKFNQAGFYPFAEKGQMFNHNFHEAIATEETDCQNGSIVRVHKRGWQRENGELVRVATVTVCQRKEQADE